MNLARLPAAMMAAVAVLLGACADGDGDPQATATATPAAICPVAEEICAFGQKTRTAVEGLDAASLVAASVGWDTPQGRADVVGAIGSVFGTSPSNVTLASIGCPEANGQPDCSAGFALVFAHPAATAAGSGGILVLGFDTTAGQPRLTGIGLPSDTADRTALLDGGRPGCSIPAGRMPRTSAEECTYLVVRPLP